ncbi:MAG: hypothetical protein ACRYG5_05480, partial [Janthinobacterium lividum]
MAREITGTQVPIQVIDHAVCSDDELVLEAGPPDSIRDADDATYIVVTGKVIAATNLETIESTNFIKSCC